MILLAISLFIFRQVLGEPIVGGDVVKINTNPWIASIKTNYIQFCGGSIISKNVILTAAHCTTKYPQDTLSIWVGSSILGIGGWGHRVDQIMRHENHSDFGPYVNDISLIKVKPTFTFGQNVAKINLARQGFIFLPGTIANVTGWGRILENGSKSRLLRSTTVSIVDNDECKRQYEDTMYISWLRNMDAKVCAAAPGSSSCHGDSGGPLTIASLQVGIVSWAMGCARPYYSEIYANIGFYRDWIERKLLVLKSIN